MFNARLTVASTGILSKTETNALRSSAPCTMSIAVATVRRAQAVALKIPAQKLETTVRAHRPAAILGVCAAAPRTRFSADICTPAIATARDYRQLVEKRNDDGADKARGIG